MRKSVLFEGRFGRMFRALPAARHDEPMLTNLANVMAANPDPDTPETERDGEENVKIPAGYTYLGQFIDHDLTFDPSSSLEKTNDPEALVDFRTPRFDLDNVYGRGPNDQPYMYDSDGLHFLLGTPLTGNNADPNTRDLPRNNPNPLNTPPPPYDPTFRKPARALIGDPRNDENVIVSQLQGLFHRFHNRLVDQALAAGGPVVFEQIQCQMRWRYQWVILHDFLPRMLGGDTIKKILPDYVQHKPLASNRSELRFYKYKQMPFIPIEFTAAAYRFGHSMVRPLYRLNQTLLTRQHIFGPAREDSLVGFDVFPNTWAIDWSLFFELETRPDLGISRVQPSYKIDTSIVNPLKNLPGPVGGNVPNLAFRNLMRGFRMGLPSGQSIAKQMHIPVLPDDKIIIGKATGSADDAQTPITAIDPAFAGNAPLWCYILSEARQDLNDIRLRGVGARLIAEVFIGLMLADSHSFLAQDPGWSPIDPASPAGAKFDMPAFVRFATSAS